MASRQARRRRPQKEETWWTSAGCGSSSSAADSIASQEIGLESDSHLCTPSARRGSTAESEPSSWPEMFNMPPMETWLPQTLRQMKRSWMLAPTSGCESLIKEHQSQEMGLEIESHLSAADSVAAQEMGFSCESSPRWMCSQRSWWQKLRERLIWLEDPRYAWYFLFVSIMAVVTHLWLRINLEVRPKALPKPEVPAVPAVQPYTAAAARAALQGIMLQVLGGFTPGTQTAAAANGCDPYDEACHARMLDFSEAASYYEDTSTSRFYTELRNWVLYFIFVVSLYAFSYIGLKRYQRRRWTSRSNPEIEYKESFPNIQDDAAVLEDDSVPFALCAVCVSVALGCVLLVPMTIIDTLLRNYVSGQDLYGGLASTDLGRIWEMLFYVSTVCHFIVLPFAFLYTESEGLGRKVGMNGSLLSRVREASSVWSRVRETSLTLLLILALLALLVQVLHMLHVPLMQHQRLTLSYIVTAMMGSVIFLLLVPFGFNGYIFLAIRSAQKVIMSEGEEDVDMRLEHLERDAQSWRELGGVGARLGVGALPRSNTWGQLETPKSESICHLPLLSRPKSSSEQNGEASSSESFEALRRRVKLPTVQCARQREREEWCTHECATYTSSNTSSDTPVTPPTYTPYTAPAYTATSLAQAASTHSTAGLGLHGTRDTEAGYLSHLSHIGRFWSLFKVLITHFWALASVLMSMALPATVVLRVVVHQFFNFEQAQLPLSLLLATGALPDLARDLLYACLDCVLVTYVWKATWLGVDSIPFLSNLYQRNSRKELTVRELCLHCLVYLCVGTSFPAITCTLGLTKIQHVKNNPATVLFQHPSLRFCFNLFFMAVSLFGLLHLQLLYLCSLLVVDYWALTAVGISTCALTVAMKRHMTWIQRTRRTLQERHQTYRFIDTLFTRILRGDFRGVYLVFRGPCRRCRVG